MTHSTKPPKTLRSREISAEMRVPERPRAPQFITSPESRRIMEEIIFNDAFNESFAGRTQMVGVNEVTAISAAGRTPCIGTSSLSSCVGLAAYDPDMKVAAVAHIMLPADNPDLGHMRRMIARTIEAGCVVGGKSFILYSFNGEGGSKERGELVSGVLQEEAESLLSSGVVTRFEKRGEHNFVLDVGSGAIFTATVT